MTTHRRWLSGVLTFGMAAAIFPAAHARSLVDMKQSNSLELCAVVDNMPYSDEQGHGRGALIDLGNAVAGMLGIGLNVTWLISAEYVRKTQCDVVPAVAALPDDDSPIHLTIPYLTVRTVLVVRQGHRRVTGTDDLRKDTVAVLANSWARHLLNKQGIDLRVAFLENEAILAAVDSGEVDAGIVTQLDFEWYQHEHAGSKLRLEPGYTLDPSLDYAASFGLRGADQATVAAFNEVLRKLMADGTVGRVFSRYGLQYRQP